MGTWVRDCEARLIQCRQPITVCIQSARKPHHPHVYHQSRQEILRLWKHWSCISIYMMMETINQNILLAPWPSTLEVLYKHCIQSVERVPMNRMEYVRLPLQYCIHDTQTPYIQLQCVKSLSYYVPILSQYHSASMAGKKLVSS